MQHVTRRRRRHIPAPAVRAKAQRQRRQEGRNARQGHSVGESPGVEGPRRLRRHQRFGQHPGDAHEHENRPTVRDDRPARRPRANPGDERQGRQQRGHDERDTDAAPDAGARALPRTLHRRGIDLGLEQQFAGARHHRETTAGRGRGAREHHRAHVEGAEAAAPGVALCIGLGVIGGRQDFPLHDDQADTLGWGRRTHDGHDIDEPESTFSVEGKDRVDGPEAPHRERGRASGPRTRLTRHVEGRCGEVIGHLPADRGDGGVECVERRLGIAASSQAVAQVVGAGEPLRERADDGFAFSDVGAHATFENPHRLSRCRAERQAFPRHAGRRDQQGAQQSTRREPRGTSSVERRRSERGESHHAAAWTAESV